MVEEMFTCLLNVYFEVACMLLFLRGSLGFGEEALQSLLGKVGS